MAKLIYKRDAEHSYDILSELLDDMEKVEYINCQSYALIYNKNLKVLKSYVDSIIRIDEFDKKIIESIIPFEAGYLKLLYYQELWASADWVLSTLNQIAGHGMIDEITIGQVNRFIESLLSDNNIINYKAEIAKIVRGNVIPKRLFALYNNMRIRTDNFRALNEAFYNPFDDEMLSNAYEESYVNNIQSSVKKKEEERLIRKIRVYNAKNRTSGVRYDNNKVYATQNFYRGDIIENAPVRILSDEDLYSPNVRELVFMIDSSKRLFGIPFGIASIARDESQTSLSANVDYEFDPEKGNVISIYAIKKIRPGDELIFKNDDFIKESSYYTQDQSQYNDFHDIKVDTNVSKNDPCHGGMPYPSLT